MIGSMSIDRFTNQLVPYLQVRIALVIEHGASVIRESIEAEETSVFVCESFSVE